MKAEEFLKSKDYIGQLRPVYNKTFVVELLQDYAKLKCKEQREICAKLEIWEGDSVGLDYFDIEERKRINNSPEPQI